MLHTRHGAPQKRARLTENNDIRHLLRFMKFSDKALRLIGLEILKDKALPRPDSTSNDAAPVRQKTPQNILQRVDRLLQAGPADPCRAPVLPFKKERS